MNKILPALLTVGTVVLSGCGTSSNAPSPSPSSFFTSPTRVTQNGWSAEMPHIFALGHQIKKSQPDVVKSIYNYDDSSHYDEIDFITTDKLTSAAVVKEIESEAPKSGGALPTVSNSSSDGQTFTTLMGQYNNKTIEVYVGQKGNHVAAIAVTASPNSDITDPGIANILTTLTYGK